MTVLEMAGSIIAERGYDYYTYGNVVSYKKVRPFVYTGRVAGTYGEPYRVKLDIMNPEKSRCSCPYYDQNYDICKHIVALFYEVSDDAICEKEEYSEDEKNKGKVCDIDSACDDFDYMDDDYYEDDDYCDEEDYYDYMDDEDYDDDEDTYIFHKKYIQDKCEKNENVSYDDELSDKVINIYVDKMSKDELKKYVLESLKHNKKDFYKEKFICQDNKDNKNIVKIRRGEDVKFSLDEMKYLTLARIDARLKNASLLEINNVDEFFKPLLTDSEKEFINKEYEKDERVREIFDRIIINNNLAYFDDYKWIIKFYIKNSNKKVLDLIQNSIRSIFISTDGYAKASITSMRIPMESLVLINNGKDDFFIDMLLNSKEKKLCINYMIYELSKEDSQKMYDIFDRKMQENEIGSNINLMDYADIYKGFYKALEEEELLYKSLYYRYRSTYNPMLLDKLLDKKSKIDYLSLLEKDKKISDESLALCYVKAKEYKKLFDFLNVVDRLFMLRDYVDELKDIYDTRLTKIFKERILKFASLGANPTYYSEIAKWTVSLYKLKDGERKVEDIIENLKALGYNKRKKMFDEIDNALRMHNKKIFGLKHKITRIDNLDKK